MLHGFLKLAVSPLGGAGYTRFLHEWGKLTPADCENDLFEVPPDLFSRPPSDDGLPAYMYDAAAPHAVHYPHSALP